MKPPALEPTDRERFLAAVVERVPLERVVELYLFQPMRQGGVESGVAVIAAAGDSPAARVEEARPDSEAAPQAGEAATNDAAQPRYTVFTARYRHVLKGPERGRWEVSVVAEADAPLDAVGAVVRGVQRRSGDVEPPEHMTGEALRDAVRRAPPPTAPR